jgi:hypothetical protein
MALLGQQGMGQRQHQCGVGVRPDRNPLRSEKVRDIRLERAHDREGDACIPGTLEPGLQHVRTAAAGGDLGVLERQAAERQDELGVGNQSGPVGDLPGHRLIGADHVRQQELGRTPAVIADLVDATAAEKQEPAHQRPSLMQATSGRPAIGAAEDAAGAVLSAHPRDLVGHQFERLVPRHLVEGVGAGARAPVMPAVTDRRPGDAQRRMHHVGNRRQHRRRRGIA